MIKENAIDRIDLLKLDAENYDIPILAGIEDKDWEKIQQICMEVHCSINAVDEHLEKVKEILESKGLVVKLDKESEYAWIGSPMLYARRK